MIRKRSAAINILYKNRKFIRGKVRMVKKFIGHNIQKMQRIIVQNIGVFVNVLQNQTKLNRIQNGL